MNDTNVRLYDLLTNDVIARLGVLLLFHDQERELGGTVPARSFAAKLLQSYGLSVDEHAEAVSLVLNIWTRRGYFEACGRDECQQPLYRIGNLGRLTLIMSERWEESQARAAIHSYHAVGGPSLH